MDTTAATYCIAAQRGDHWWTSLQPVTVLQPKGGPLVDTTTASYTVSQPKGGPLVDITIASYCIAAQGGTIGGHYNSQLLYCSPRGDHWWTSLQPVTVLQPKGGPLVDIIIASYCIAAQGGTIGGHYHSQLHCITAQGGPLVDITTASYCIAAQGGTIGGHYNSQLDVCITAPRPLVQCSSSSALTCPPG